MDSALKEWLPDKHFMVTALTFLKKIFYMKSFDEFPVVANEEARRRFELLCHFATFSDIFLLVRFKEDKDSFLQAVTEEVKASLRRVHEPQSPLCSLVFTEPKPVHEVLREQIISKVSSADTDCEAESAHRPGGGDDKDSTSSALASTTIAASAASRSAYYDHTNEVFQVVAM